MDATLIFGTGVRPAVTADGIERFYPFPNGAGANDWLDLAAAIDWGRGKPVYAHFRVTTTFAGAAGNTLRFVVAVDSVTNFANTLTNPGLFIVRGPQLVTAGLVATNAGPSGNVTTWGLDVDLVLPPLNTLVIPNTTDVGAQFLTLGFQATAAATDWTAGGVDAWLSTVPHAVRQPNYQRA